MPALFRPTLGLVHPEEEELFLRQIASGAITQPTALEDVIRRMGPLHRIRVFATTIWGLTGGVTEMGNVATVAVALTVALICVGTQGCTTSANDPIVNGDSARPGDAQSAQDANTPGAQDATLNDSSPRRDVRQQSDVVQVDAIGPSLDLGSTDGRQEGSPDAMSADASRDAANGDACRTQRRQTQGSHDIAAAPDVEPVERPSERAVEPHDSAFRL